MRHRISEPLPIIKITFYLIKFKVGICDTNLFFTFSCNYISES